MRQMRINWHFHFIGSTNSTACT